MPCLVLGPVCTCPFGEQLLFLIILVTIIYYFYFFNYMSSCKFYHDCTLFPIKCQKTVLLAHFRTEHIEMFGDVSLQCILQKKTSMTETPRVQLIGPSATMSGPQLMSLLPLQYSLGCDFGKTATSSGL